MGGSDGHLVVISWAQGLAGVVGLMPAPVVANSRARVSAQPELEKPMEIYRSEFCIQMEELDLYSQS